MDTWAAGGLSLQKKKEEKKKEEKYNNVRLQRHYLLLYATPNTGTMPCRLMVAQVLEEIWSSQSIRPF